MSLPTTRFIGPIRATSRFWVLAAAFTLVVVGLLPLLWDRRYFFRGDTQIAYSGWWYHLGEQALQGRLPLLEPLNWEAGNYVAEGQWGLFSPLTILIGILATVLPNLVVFVTLLKIGLLVVGGLGTYCLIRSFDVAAPAAYVGAVLVGLGGQSVFYEWPSWVNGQLATSLLPWAWFFTRRAMRRGANPLPALLMCYLVVSIGYVYAPLYLAIVLLGCLVDAALARDRPAFLRALGIGVFSGLVVVTVYLPGILTSPVTIRSTWEIVGAGRRTVGLDQILTSVLPTTKERYLLWCLPMLAWISASRAREAIKDLGGVLVSTGLLLVWVLGPSTLGPIRWPVRVLPALMVTLVVLVVVLVARSIRAPVGWVPVAVSLAWVAAAASVGVARNWDARGETVASMFVVGTGLILLAWGLRHGAAATALLIGCWTVIVFSFQHAVSPSVEANDRNMPSLTVDYRTQLPAARGDVMVIGSFNTGAIQEPSVADDLLVGSSWNLNPRSVQNGYTTISFKAFNQRFCRTFNGGTCPELLKAVLARERTTGRRWVDLLSISTLVMYRPDFNGSVLGDPPRGWRVADTSRWAVTWVRDDPVPTAGGLVWASPGVEVSEVTRDDQTVRLIVDEVPPEGGTLVFSRLAWPGYQVSGASLGDPLQDMLVRVELSQQSADESVTLAWRVPGWRTEQVAWWLAIAAGLVWSLVHAIIRRRGRPAGHPSAGVDSHDNADETELSSEVARR